jgi:Glyoxalase-like domain
MARKCCGVQVYNRHPRYPLIIAASVTILQGGWGTENYIIPLGAGYIEIAAVWDPEAAQSCDWGK